jgi:uncharacterized protein YqjF (DUF2071 family)
MSFLKAEWRKLIMANYSIDSSILKDYIPFGTELDLWEGKCYVSLVGFMFLDTKLLGIPIPFHKNFEEVNLRFYVKRYENGEWKRGVVFIKEIVPKFALSLVANMVYNENYETMPMKHNWEMNDDKQVVSYEFKKQGKWNRIKVETKKKAKAIIVDSEIEFITEHYWGYAKINSNQTNEYEVTHPKWKAYDILNYEIDIDFGLIYGAKFQLLNSIAPCSVMLAEGSEITVEPKKKIK